MKKIFLVFALTFTWFFTAFGQKEKLVSLFDKYQETEGVTSIKIAKPMFSMLSKLEIDEAGMESIKPVLDKIEGLRILVLEKPEKSDGKETEYAKLLSSFNTLQSEIAGSVKNMNYDELITVKSKGNNIRFLASNAVNGMLDNLLLSVNSEDNTVLMMLDGRLSMDDVNRLVNESQNTVQPEKSTSDVSESVRNVAAFNTVEVSSGIKVTFTQDQKQNVTVNADADLQKYVKTEVSGNVLKVFVSNTERRNLNFRKLHVNISAPKLEKITANSGANFITLNVVDSDSFEAKSSSGATVSADVKADNIKVSSDSGANLKMNLQAKNVEVRATSGSDMTLVGKTQDSVFDLTSAASVNAQDLSAENAKVTAASAANLKINVSGKLNAKITSKANVRYRPNNTMDRNAVVNSGGSLKPL